MRTHTIEYILCSLSAFSPRPTLLHRGPVHTVVHRTTVAINSTVQWVVYENTALSSEASTCNATPAVQKPPIAPPSIDRLDRKFVVCTSLELAEAAAVAGWLACTGIAALPPAL